MFEENRWTLVKIREFEVFFSRASDEWLPRKPKKIFVVWRFAMSVYVTNRLMKKDNAIVCRYASKYNLLILLLVCWRPKIESADRPLNTGSTSNQQDFPDKRLIKSFIPSVFVRASMVQMSPSCELTYYVTVLCSFDPWVYHLCFLCVRCCTVSLLLEDVVVCVWTMQHEFPTTSTSPKWSGL